MKTRTPHPVQSRTVLQHPRTYWGDRLGLGCAALIDQLTRHLPVRLCAWVVGGVVQDRPVRDGRIREFNGAFNDGVEHLIAECVNNAGQYLFGVGGACIKHGGKYANNVQVGVEPILHFLD